MIIVKVSKFYLYSKAIWNNEKQDNQNKQKKTKDNTIKMLKQKVMFSTLI